MPGMLNMPQTPGFASPWEQMAFQTGGMLGQIPQALMQGQARQAENQAVQQITQNATSPADRYSQLGNYFAENGKMDMAHQMFDNAQKQASLELSASKFGQSKAVDEFNQEMAKKRLAVEQQRADAYTKSIAKMGLKGDKKTAAQRNVEAMQQAYKNFNDTSKSPEDRAMWKDAYNVLRKVNPIPKTDPKQIKDYQAFLKKADTGNIPEDVVDTLAYDLADRVHAQMLQPGETRSEDQVRTDILNNMKEQYAGSPKIGNFLTNAIDFWTRKGLSGGIEQLKQDIAYNMGNTSGDTTGKIVGGYPVGMKHTVGKETRQWNGKEWVKVSK